jgi:DeoR/GlpR family transcriptional regulator of sugar metabolism
MDFTKRRRFIIEKIYDKGFVSFDEVERFIQGGMPADWYKSDQADFFEKFGLPIKIMGRNFVSALPENRHKTYAIREEHQSDEKRLVAQAACTMIGGAAELGPLAIRFRELHDRIKKLKIDQRTRERRTAEETEELMDFVRTAAHNVLKHCSDVKRISDLLQMWDHLDPLGTDGAIAQASPGSRKRNVLQLLNNYFRKSHRHIVIDSGTTTKAIADCLAQNHFWTGPPFLTVYTNSPRIESALEDSKVEVVGLMGEVRKDTSARTGPWCQRSLELLRGLSLDIGIVGTTGLAFDASRRLIGFSSDSAPEALTKSTMLELVNIRVVCADGEKLGRGTSSTFVFAAADGGSIDVLVTDYSATQGEAKGFLDQLAKAGITVIISGGKDKDDDELTIWKA